MGNYSNFLTHGYQIETQLETKNERGIVQYKANQIATNQPVLIKEFQFAQVSSNWSGYNDLASEKQILEQLDHPGIPKYLDYFETNSSFCLVCEYKHGISLANSGDFAWSEIKAMPSASFAIALNLLEILIYLQEQPQPVVHRNIKPENILIDNTNGQLQVSLIDFSSATLVGQVDDDKLADDTLWLTPLEQTLDLGLSLATDLYSLGMTLVCMLTDTQSRDIGTLVSNNHRLNLKSLLPWLHPQFLHWLEKITSPQPELRFSNALFAYSALNSIDFEPTSLSVPATTKKLAKSITVATFVAGIFATVNALQCQFPKTTALYSSRSVPASSLSINCEQFTGLGNYQADFGERGGSIRSVSISCIDALDNCQLNASYNPSSDLHCTWNDLVIFTTQNRFDSVLEK